MAKGRGASRAAQRQMQSVINKSAKADIASFKKLVNKTKGEIADGGVRLANISDVTSTAPDILNRGTKKGLSMSERYNNAKTTKSSFGDSVRSVKNNKKSITPEDVRGRVTPITTRTGAIDQTIKSPSRVPSDFTPNNVRKGSYLPNRNVSNAANRNKQIKDVDSNKKGLMHAIASSAPMKAVAGASVATLVMGNMVRSKGQQSNSELYGQRMPYM